MKNRFSRAFIILLLLCDLMLIDSPSFSFLNVLTSTNINEKTIYTAEKAAAYVINNAVAEDGRFKWLIYDTYGSWERPSEVAKIGIFFASLYQATGKSIYLDYAKGAAQWIIMKAVPERGGYKWACPDRDRPSPGWWLNIAVWEVGEFLLMMYKLTGNNTYLVYAKGAAQWMIAMAEPEAAGYFIPYNPPGKTGSQASFGIMPGREALAATFLLHMYQETGNSTYLFYAKETAEWLMTSPDIRSESGGYTWIHDRPYYKYVYIVAGSSNPGGTAGVANFFYEIYQVTHNTTYLHYANGAIQWILSKAVFVTESSVKWPQNIGRSDYSIIIGLPPFTKYATMSDLLLYAYSITGNSTYLEYARKHLNWIISEAISSSSGYVWRNNENAYATSMIYWSLCNAFQTIKNNTYAEYAAQALNWIINDATSTDGGCKWKTVTYNPYYPWWFIYGASGIGYYISQAKSTYTLTVYVYRSGTSTGISGVIVEVDDSPYTTDSSGRVAVTVTYGSHTVEVVTPYYPSSDTRYVFTQWSDGSTSNPRTVNVSSDMVLKAYMRLEYFLRMAVSPGFADVEPGSKWYEAGSSVSISASPPPGYTFDCWVGSGSGSYTGSSIFATITMNEPIMETAFFFTFPISISPSSGSTTPERSVTATVTVRYESGYNAKTISFSASGLPSGASAIFSPSSVTISPSNPSATSTMTITTSSSTPAGTYTVTITGSGGGLSKTTTYTLTVNPAVYTISFQVLDDAGSAVSGATLAFDGVSYSHGGSVSKPAGSYSLLTLTIPSGYRFSQWQASGGVSISNPSFSSTTATVSGSGTITLRLQRTATVTFSVSGMGSDASGTVLTVDGTSYSYSSLPVTFTWDVGSQHSFTWTEYVSAGSGKRYAWVSTSGLSTSRTGTINVPSGGGSVQATYKTQYQWTFEASGLSSDASGTVVTVDGSNYAYSQLPVSFWWDSGSSHSYSYQQYVSSTTSGKRYANHNPPSWSGTVTGPGSLNQAYHVEYKLTVIINPFIIDPFGKGSVSARPSSDSWFYDDGSTVTLSVNSPTGFLIQYIFTGWSGDITSSDPNITIVMNSPKTIIANWRADYTRLYMMGVFFMTLSSLILAKYAYNRRNRRIRSLIPEIIKATLERGRITFAELAKEYRIKPKDVEKIIREHHNSGTIKGVFIIDGQGYITLEKIKEEIMEIIKGNLN